MPITITRPMKQRLSPRAHQMIERSLQFFPELTDTTITVGYTRKHLGSATVVYRKGVVAQLIIRLRIKKLTYQTIGHELIHLVQGLARGDPSMSRSSDLEKIPSGEKQCDIWTLARNPLFCDDAPTYLKMPRILRDQWPSYAERVRELCHAAIAKRHTHRLYIRWLENEMDKLAKALVHNKRAPAQLDLPFVI